MQARIVKLIQAFPVNKCLIFQKTIRGIKFSKELLEVTVFIKDTNESMVEDFFRGQGGRLAVKLREGTVNPDAPACNRGSVLQNGDPSGQGSNLTLILPQNLLDKTRFK